MTRAVQVESLWNGITDASGEPVAAGKVYSYDAGTSTPRSLYTTYDKSVAHANPLILDGVGKALAFADGSYKFIITDSADTTLYTHDNLRYNFDDTASYFSGSSTGAANTYTLTPPSGLTALTDGMKFSFKAHQSTTSSSTLTVTGLGTKSLMFDIGYATTTDTIRAGGYYTVIYDETNDHYKLANSTRQPYLSVWGGLTTGAANVFTIAGTPQAFTYFDNQEITFRAHQANTGACTIVSSYFTRNIRKGDGTVELDANDIESGKLCVLKYDSNSSSFILLNPSQEVWTAYTPTFGGSGSMTYTSVTSTFLYSYKRKHLTITGNCSGTLGGTANTAITITLPSGFTTNGGTGGGCFVVDAGTFAAGMFNIGNGQSTLNFYRYNNSNYTLGTGGVFFNLTLRVN